MRRDKESGYALLLVFLMAAVVAISLYSEIPRVAFQSQRHKEQLLMERGQQYIRAIQVFRQANRAQWPRNLDDLENFQNRHYLRHKYIDPMTGKSEWRLVHIQGGMLTDSAFTKKPADKPGTAGSESTYITAYAGLGQTPAGAQNFRPQDRRRASEGASGPGAGEPAAPFPGSPPDQNSQIDPGAQPGSSPSQPGAPPAADAPFSGAPAAPGMPGVVASPPSQSALFQPGQQLPGSLAQPGQPGSPNPLGPASAPPAPNAAVAMINQLLTTPNPRAAQIVAQQSQQAAASGGVDSPGGGLGGGGLMAGLGISGQLGSSSSSAAQGAGSYLAGVASKMEREGIMVYNDRTAYNEWEFVFDPTKVQPISAPGGGVPGSTPAGQMGAQAGAGMQMGPGGLGGGPGMGMGTQLGQLGAQAGQMGGRMGPGPPASGGGSASNPAAMQSAGGSASGLPPGFRMGRP